MCEHLRCDEARRDLRMLRDGWKRTLRRWEREWWEEERERWSTSEEV